jgi:hypothetical protein
MTNEQSGSNEVARRLGRSAGKFAKAARAAAKRAQPEAERLAQQARPAAERLAQQAKPAAQRAGKFLREHEGEIRQAGAASARIVASKSTPPVLRPIVGMVVDEVARMPKSQRPPSDRDVPPQK